MARPLASNQMMGVRLPPSVPDNMNHPRKRVEDHTLQLSAGRTAAAAHHLRRHRGL